MFLYDLQRILWKTFRIFGDVIYQYHFILFLLSHSVMQFMCVWEGGRYNIIKGQVALHRYLKWRGVLRYKFTDKKYSVFHYQRRWCNIHYRTALRLWQHKSDTAVFVTASWYLTFGLLSPFCSDWNWTHFDQKALMFGYWSCAIGLIYIIMEYVFITPLLLTLPVLFSAPHYEFHVWVKPLSFF